MSTDPRPSFVSPIAVPRPEHDVRWRWRQLIWLGYLPLILVGAALTDTSAREWVLLVVSLLFVAVLVTRAIREDERSLFPLYAFTLGLAVALSPSNGAAVVLFAYAAGAAGYLERTTVAAWLIGVVVAAASVEAWLVHNLFLFSAGALVASFVGLVNLHFATYRRASLALQRAHQEIERLAAVAERERIARDLHDVLGHTLSLVAIKADLAARLAEHSAPEAAAESRDVCAAARDALAEIRRVVTGYRTRLTDEIGMARALLEAAGVDADIIVDTTELSTAHEAALAFALREGVTNVVRHANAKRCAIRLRSDGDFRVLEIEDDGVGIARGEGNGLEGMRQRARAVEGRVDVASTAAGTALRVLVPLRGVDA